MLIGKRRM